MFVVSYWIGVGSYCFIMASSFTQHIHLKSSWYAVQLNEQPLMPICVYVYWSSISVFPTNNYSVTSKSCIVILVILSYIFCLLPLSSWRENQNIYRLTVQIFLVFHYKLPHYSIIKWFFSLLSFLVFSAMEVGYVENSARYVSLANLGIRLIRLTISLAK